MPSYSSSDIRNIVMAGHAGGGKTTLVEILLHTAGVLGSVGTVEGGDTLSDFTDEEKAHGHSMASTIAHCDYQGKHINIIDTPGAPDFLGQALEMLPAAETMVMVIDAAAGIEPMTRRMMACAKELKLCRMIVINKLDMENTELEGLVATIQETFGSQCLPINLPAQGGKSVVDCFLNPSGDSDFGSVAEAHTAIIDQVVEVDEELMEVYLEQGEVKPEQLHAPFEVALRDGHLVPICFVSARPHEDPDNPVGIEPWLDVLVKLVPNPKEGNPKKFFRGDDGAEPIYAEVDPSKAVLGHVFQIKIDSFVGKLCAFRVHQGTVTKDSQLFVGNAHQAESKKPFKVGHLFKLQGAKHVEIDAAIPGDIAAVAKVEHINYDAVLHDSHDEDQLHMNPVDFPEPMTGLAITATRRGNEQKIADALNRFKEEDPCFKVTRDAVTKETVIRGLGDLHLRIILEKLKNRYGITVEAQTPKIAYRETIQAKAEGHHRHKKQTGGAGQFGEVYLRVEPMERDSGFEFTNEIFGGSIPHQYIPAIEKGVRQALEEGAIAGYPLQDIKVSVYDGKHHPVDSKEVAFVAAGKRAFVDAVQNAKPVLLEPMVAMEVTVPSQFMGDITSDLSGKRGRISGTDMLGGDQALIQAVVPLAEVVGYQSQLKSVTGGQGSFTMELDHYDPVPGNVQQQIIAQFKPKTQDN